MSQITIRGLDNEVEKRIRNEAKQKGKSLSKVVLDMLYEHTGRKKEKQSPRGDSLRNLAGGWSRKEADRFLESIKSCEQIDKDMWK
jgi:hypothetical protein